MRNLGVIDPGNHARALAEGINPADQSRMEAAGLVTPARRQAVTLAIVSPSRPKGSREKVITFVRKVARKRDLGDFLTTATDHDLAHIEGLLGL